MLRKYHKPAEYVLLSYLIYEETEAQRDEVPVHSYTTGMRQSQDSNPVMHVIEGISNPVRRVIEGISFSLWKCQTIGTRRAFSSF